MNIERFVNKKGFIAALDQSGGSIERTLTNYGIKVIDENKYEIIHNMKIRILKNLDLSKIKGVILFMDEIENDIPSFLLDKDVVSFLKIDNGLEEKRLGVSLMKNIPYIKEKINKLKNKKIFGTKMRSVIYEKNEEGIKQLVKQQFDIAKIIYKNGLIPIIEPEVDINSKEKKQCEILLKNEIDKQLRQLENEKVILKLTIPEIDNLYEEYTHHKNILEVVALSGGYSKDKACEKLSKNKGMIACFSRALLEGIKVNQTDIELKKILNNNVEDIYNASFNKERK